MFQQLLVNKHHRLHDSKFGREEVWVWSLTKINKSRVEHEPRSAHGRAVNYQQAYFRRSQGAWNKITTHFTRILIIIALTRNNGCTNFNRWGIFLSKKIKFAVLFAWPLLFYRQKPKQNNFRVFEELVFFDLWIPFSSFWIPVFGSGFRFPVSWF